MRSVVITGVDRSFCAGGSLASLSTPTPGEMRHLYRASLRLFDAIRTCPRPVIAAVNGPAAGGGNELVVACDLAIAARSATFGQTGPRVGSCTGHRRDQRHGRADRREAGQGVVDAVPAVSPPTRRCGWVWSTPSSTTDELEATVEAWCAELAALSPRYLEITKISSNLWWNAARDSFSTGLGMLVQAIGSPDMVEGAIGVPREAASAVPRPRIAPNLRNDHGPIAISPGVSCPKAHDRCETGERVRRRAIADGASRRTPARPPGRPPTPGPVR